MSDVAIAEACAHTTTYNFKLDSRLFAGEVWVVSMLLNVRSNGRWGGKDFGPQAKSDHRQWRHTR